MELSDNFEEFEDKYKIPKDFRKNPGMYLGNDFWNKKTNKC